MKKSTFCFLVSISFLTLIFFSACRHEKEKAKWETELLLPLLHSVLDLNSLLPDSLLESDAEGRVTLVLRQNVFTWDPTQELLKVPDTSLEYSVSLDNISLGDRMVTQKVTLGELARQMMQSPDQQTQFLGIGIIALHGTQNANIPVFSNISSENIDFDATDFFQSATIISGYLKIEIENGLPIPIDSVKFRLTNRSDGTVVAEDSIMHIPAYGSASKIVDLSGKSVEGQLRVRLLNISSPGGVGVAVDTSDALTVTLSIEELSLYEATAVFPAQNVIDIDQEVNYYLDGPELTFLKVKSGRLNVRLTSTIEDTITFNFELPRAYDGSGNPLKLRSKLPPAPPGGVVTIYEDFKLDGFNIDLRGKDGNKFNTFTQRLRASIDSTGLLRHISLEDSIYVFYGLLDIIPEYAKGYFGSDTVYLTSPGEVTNNWFDKVISGNFSLEKGTLELALESGFGAEGQLKIDHLTSIREQSIVPLVSPYINQPITIQRAFDNPLRISTTRISMNEQNSNALALIENMPKAFGYGMEVIINPNGNSFNYQDFGYFNSVFSVNLDAALPFSFKVDNLIFIDTTDFALNVVDEDIENLRDGIINLIAYNGFPMDVFLQIYVYDDYWNLIDSLFPDKPVAAGKLDAVNCRVNEIIRTRHQLAVDQDRIRNLNNGTRSILKARFNTVSNVPSCSGMPLRIYSDYKIDLKITARFNFRL